MLYYFLESILKKLIQGKYGGHLVFKGGFLLSNVVGIESRSTMDIDFLLQNMQVWSYHARSAGDFLRCDQETTSHTKRAMS